MPRSQFSIRTLLWLTLVVAIISVIAGGYLRLNSRLRNFYEVEVRSAVREGSEPPWPVGNEGKEWRKWPPD